MKQKPILQQNELARYARHLTLPSFGIQAQQKLKAAKVLIVGAGGLGCPLLLYLTAAGVGHIGIVDYDVVDESNLQRQVLFTVADIGKPKAQVAKERLQALNPHVKITTYHTALHKDNALHIIKDYDLVADGSDNFPTRYLVNDAAILCSKPNVYAAIFRYEGQVSVFNYTNEKGETGPNYRHLFPQPPPPGSVPSCAEGGVLGVLPGIIGSIQASEVIKVITGIGKPLAGRMFLIDTADFSTRILQIKNNDIPKVTQLVDYHTFCGVPTTSHSHNIKEISPDELKQWIAQKIDFQLIDVREPHEYEQQNIQGELIPLTEMPQSLDRIAKNKKVVIHCQSGIRSTAAIMKLQQMSPFDNLYNLRGGLNAFFT